MASRMFVASFDDIQGWARDGERLIKTLEEDDIIFFIKGDTTLTTAKTKLIDRIKKTVEVHIADANGVNQGLLAKQLLLEFMKKEKKKSYVLFIIGASLKCIYDDREDLEQFAESVLYNHNFQVKRMNLKKDNTEDEENVQMLMNAILESDEGEQEKEQNKKKEQKLGMPNKAKEKINAKKYSHATSLEATRSTIEKNVFGSAIESIEYEEVFTELEEAKASFVEQLRKRTEKHIRQYLFQKKSTIVLTNDEFFDLVALMMGSENAAVFMQSWNSQHTLDMEMTEETFTVIKPELTYFNVICELLYDRDFWEE